MSDRAAKALWLTGVGAATCRETPFALPDGALEIRTCFTGISRGTERLVYRGQVPPGEHDTMRAPFQEGAFTFPVKYGYCAVGEAQNTRRAGEMVFALFPHQTRFAVPDEAAVTIPQTVPPQRAVLAANMETALNILWDGRVNPGDYVAIIGAGVVGALTGYLCAQIPGTDVCLIDINPRKAALASALGCRFATPDEAVGDADIVIHSSASSDGLDLAVNLAGIEASIIEASWYGTAAVTAPLGGRFHQRRLRIIGSQVGRIPPHMAPRWSHRRRLQKALALLCDPALDILISGESAFDDLAQDYGAILDDPGTLCHRIRYPQGGA